MLSVTPTVADPAGQRSLRVVVADGSYLVREAVARLLTEEDGIEVVASCGDRGHLLRAAERTRPDVVVTEAALPPANVREGTQTAATLRRERPRLGIVMLGEIADPAYGPTLLNVGVDGCAYLLKERVHSGAQLVGAVKTVARGGSLIDARVVDDLAARRAGVEYPGLRELTPREAEVLACIARGLSNQAIADELVLTKRAVEKHINAIYLKLGLTVARDVSCRVKATLIHLGERDDDAIAGRRALQATAVARANG